MNLILTNEQYKIVKGRMPGDFKVFKNFKNEYIVFLPGHLTMNEFHNIFGGNLVAKIHLQ